MTITTKAIFLIVVLATTVMGAPLSTTTDSSEVKTTTSPPPDNGSTQQLAQNVSQAALQSWQSATILLTHIEDVILAGSEVPPSAPCFQEEREPSSTVPPDSSTDYLANFAQDYSSLQSYKKYFDLVADANSGDIPSETTDAVYTIELTDFRESLDALIEHVKSLLTALDSSALNKGEDGTPVPEDCNETCYGQQVSTLRAYSTLVYNYIPSDIEGLKKDKKL